MKINKLFGAKEEPVPYHPEKDPKYDVPINAEELKKIFADCDDFVATPVHIGGKKSRTVSICFLDGVVSGVTVSELVLRPLSDPYRFGCFKTDKELADIISTGAVYGYSVKRCNDTDTLVNLLLNGFCALVFDEIEFAVCFETRTSDKRQTEKPDNEKSVRGAKDSFVETIRNNTSLVRRKLRNPNLKIKQHIVGRQTATNVAVVYIDGLTDPDTVDEVTRRILRMDTEGILGPAALEEYICDNPYTPLPQVVTTERPDRFCMELLEGRVGILIDGLPFGYMAPGTFTQFLKVPEDEANHWVVASAMTFLRYFALCLSLFLPAFYVAIAVYHQEMIPTRLMISIIESKQDVPFTTVMEVFGILVAFELLQEAGLRLPTPVGETIGIIGALIVGQSAVEAKVISPIVIIVVATAGISGYTIPSQELSLAIRIFRFLNVIISTLLGMFGIAVSVVLFIYRLCSIESFGVTYMTPFAGRYTDDTGGLFRKPLIWTKFRDRAFKPQNIRNQR